MCKCAGVGCEQAEAWGVQGGGGGGAWGVFR